MQFSYREICADHLLTVLRSWEMARNHAENSLTRVGGLCTSGPRFF